MKMERVNWVLPSYHFSAPRPGLNLAQHLSAFYLHWWSRPLKQPQRHPLPSPTFLSVSLPRACTIALHRQISKNSVCPITTAAPTPFLSVCVGLFSQCFFMHPGKGVSGLLWYLILEKYLYWNGYLGGHMAIMQVFGSKSLHWKYWMICQ